MLWPRTSLKTGSDSARLSIGNWGVALGRCLLASLFLLGGLNKILNYSETAAHMTEVGLPMAGSLLPLVILLELGAGALVAFAGPFYRIAALALAGFTVLTNFVFHEFWNMQGDIRALEISLFFKNIFIAGGLLLIVSLGREKP